MKPPSWVVRQPVLVRSAPWATPEPEPPPSLPKPASLPPPRRLSVVPPAGPSETDELRGTIGELRAKLDALVAEMGQMRLRHEQETEVLKAEREAFVKEAQQAIVRLAVAIAERAVGAELAQSPELIVKWAEEAVAALGGGVVVAHPSMVLDDGGADPALAPNTVEVRHDGSVVEVSAAARVAAVAGALDSEAA